MAFSTAGRLAVGQLDQDSRIHDRPVQMALFYTITQMLAWCLFAPFFYLLYDLRVYGRKNFLSAPKPLIIISNHISFLDGFLINVVAGFFSQNRPFRHMAVLRFKWPMLNALQRIGVIRFVYSLFGVFTVTPGLGIEKNLDMPRKILDERGTVVIYPEGSIVMGDHIMPFRKGAAALSIESNVPVLPISLRKGKRDFLRKKLYINIGEIIFPDNKKLEDLSSELYQSVNGLYIRSPHFWIYEHH